jgi:hypothetical protein
MVPIFAFLIPDTCIENLHRNQKKGKRCGEILNNSMHAKSKTSNAIYLNCKCREYQKREKGEKEKKKKRKENY